MISDTKLQTLYSNMLHCRLLTEHAIALRIKPRDLHPYRASLGQEAVAAGWVTDLQAGDTVAMAAGDSTPGLVKGTALEELIAQLYALREGEQLAPVNAGNVLAASQDPEELWSAVAATAFAAKRKKKGQVVVCFASAATSTLAPWQGMVTLAAGKKLPVVFVIENNPWTPGETKGVAKSKAAGPDGSAADRGDFTQWARSYGLSGISVDGNDVVAIYRVACESLDRVRKGDGPVMVESKTYTESGGKKRSRGAERDPLKHMESYLKAKKLFRSSWKDQLVEEFTKELKRAAKKARNS